MSINTALPGINLPRIATLTLVCLYFIAVFIINIVPFLGGELDLLDFGSFYASGLNLRNGENPYGANSEYVLDIDFPRVGAGGKMINLNPPISAMAFGLISEFDPHQAFKTWQVTSAILFTCVIFILTAFYKQNVAPIIFIWSFAWAGFWQTLILGQIYVFLLLFVVLGWVLIQRKSYILGGLAIGVVVAIKPNFIIWPIFLMASGHALPFLAAAVSSLLISLIPVLFYGVQIYQQWLEASALRLGTVILPGNSSIVGLTARFQNITAGVVISIVLICTLLYFLGQKAPIRSEPLEYVSALGIIASILASPISWVGYTLFLLPFFFSLKRWTLPAILSAAILSFPFIFVLKLWQTSFTHFVIFGWFYGWGLIVLLGVLVSALFRTKSIQANESTISNDNAKEVQTDRLHNGDNP